MVESPRFPPKDVFLEALIGIATYEIPECIDAESVRIEDEGNVDSDAFRKTIAFREVSDIGVVSAVKEPPGAIVREAFVVGL